MLEWLIHDSDKTPLLEIEFLKIKAKQFEILVIFVVNSKQIKVS